jgi:molybdopterin-guanine dinucleotide biosynthesis protein
MNNIKLGAGVLAGGRSTRMGQNKALLQINNRKFIDCITDELSAFNEVLISAAAKGTYEELGFRVVYDEHADIGPIEGIYQLLKHSNEEYIFICAADMPFIKKELVSYMAEFISSDYDCFCLTDEEHVHPLCAIYSKKMLGVIEELIANGQYRLMNVLNAVRTKYISLEMTCFDKKIVKNVNTRDDYKRLVLPLVFCVSAVKNSGKTGLVVRLINEFITEGYSVGVIKHDGHDYVMDHEGTDTWRFSEAGAACSAIFSGSRFSVNECRTVGIEEMISKCNDVDILIIEGMKNSDYPKIEIVRREISSKSICNPDSLICIATDIVSQSEVSCPIFGLDDTQGIFLCVKKYFGLE